jgi:tetratricopeptide (TPR) repeat protein
MIHGANFYNQEQWEPGKFRRWMRNDGDLRIQNNGGPLSIDLRFVAESFRIARTLRVQMGDHALLEVTVPPAASLFVAVKDVQVPSGDSLIVLSASPGPDQASRYLKNGDDRELTVAFGPFSVIDAHSPQAQLEETAAFPEASRRVPGLSALEDTAGDLRRQGRLLEANAAYQEVLTSRQIHPSTYLWEGLSLVALDRLDEARPLFERGSRLGGLDVVTSSVRDACGRLLGYLGQSALLAGRPADPAREFRERGEIYRAVALYRSTLTRDPQNLAASYWLGLLSALAERPREAIPLLDVVAKRSPAGSADATMAKWLEQYLGSR